MKKQYRIRDEIIKCPSCGGQILYRASFSPENRARVAKLLNIPQGRIEAIRTIREILGISLVEAKGILLHLSTKPNVCHLCENHIEGFTVICQNCHSVNFNWTESEQISKGEI